MKNSWNHTTYHPLYAGELPATAGVYAVLRVRRLLGIPLDTEVIYIGKTQSLQKRFKQHVDPYRQHNKALNEISDREQLEFWYLQTPADELDTTERLLIRELEPKANKVRYANGLG